MYIHVFIRIMKTNLYRATGFNNFKVLETILKTKTILLHQSVNSKVQ